MDNDLIIIIISSLCCLLTIIISLYHIIRHLVNFTVPDTQLSICRILLIIPIESIVSLINIIYLFNGYKDYSYTDNNKSLSSSGSISSSSSGVVTASSNIDDEQNLFTFIHFIGSFRDVYEAYTIYTFYNLLISYLRGEEVIADWLELRGIIRHPYPVRYFFPSSIRLGKTFLFNIRQGTLQFVFVKPFLSLISLLMGSFGVYHEGRISLYDGYFYCSLIFNISITISMYSLVLFYISTKTRLEPFRPLLKYLIVKSVIFFGFWQSLALQIMVWIKIIPTIEQAMTIHFSLMCFEMLIASIVNIFAFPVGDFEVDSKTGLPLISGMVKVLDIKDVIEDGANGMLLISRIYFFIMLMCLI